MDVPFPFGFPLPTAMYLVLYVVTLIVHVVFMSYVLAGSGYVAIAKLLATRGASATSGTVTGTLTDWLPFLLGAAITAGVAPLLFVQILYQHAFYTANLLLFHRWMAILPALIIGFYLLYLSKSRSADRLPAFIRALICIVALICFAFTAYTWTENHVLSKQGPDAWATFYATDTMMYRHAEVVPRLAVWFAGSIPIMLLLVSWQTWYGGRTGRPGADPAETRRVHGLSGIALASLVATVVCVWNYYQQASDPVRHAVTGTLVGGYSVAALIGVLVQAGGWCWQWTRRTWNAKCLSVVSAGLAATVLGTTVVREGIRLEAIDITSLYDQHEHAGRVGGLFVFLAFLAANLVAIAFCISLAGRARRKAAQAQAAFGRLNY